MAKGFVGPDLCIAEFDFDNDKRKFLRCCIEKDSKELKTVGKTIKKLKDSGSWTN